MTSATQDISQNPFSFSVHPASHSTRLHYGDRIYSIGHLKRVHVDLEKNICCLVIESDGQNRFIFIETAEESALDRSVSFCIEARISLATSFTRS